MDTDRFIVYIKTEDFYRDISQDIETRFGTSKHEIDRPLPKAKNKKVSRFMKDESPQTIITEFAG